MRPILFLYVLATYILLQFCWWAYLLLELNDEIFEHKIENVRLTAASPELESQTIAYFEKKKQQRRWMVAGEGGVFLTLLLWGSVLSIRSFKKEFELARQQKNFLLSITHEFKSPLASIKLYLQTILKHDLDREKEITFLNNAINDTERLNTLVENALLANLINHKGYSFSKENLNLSAFLRLQVQKFQQVPNHGTVETHIQDGIFMDADMNSLNLLINNLLENARKYSAKNTPIVVSLEKNEKCIRLCVADNGPGIPDDEKAKVFRKFYRIGNEETRQTKGTGLGLFIVKYISEGHKGQVLIKDNKPHGSIFCVEFKCGQYDK